MWLLLAQTCHSVLYLQPVPRAGLPLLVGQQHLQGQEQAIMKLRGQCVAGQAGQGSLSAQGVCGWASRGSGALAFQLLC